MRRSLSLGVIIGLFVLLVGVVTNPSIVGLIVGMPLAALSFGFIAASCWTWWRVALANAIVTACIVIANLFSFVAQEGEFSWIAFFVSGVVGVVTYLFCLVIGTRAFIGNRVFRKIDEVRRGFCPVCHYSLAGVESDRCPECGELCFGHFPKIDELREIIRTLPLPLDRYGEYTLVEVLLDHPLLRWCDVIDCIRTDNAYVRSAAARFLDHACDPPSSTRPRHEDPAFWESQLAARGIDPSARV